MAKHPYQMDLKELREECRDRGISAEETAGKADLINRIILFDHSMYKPDLEPAGYKRDEQLAQRQDELDQRIEEDPREVYKLDPKALEPDRDILKSLDQRMLDVTNKVKGYQYAWAYFGLNSHMVWAKRALGWEVVTGPMPEAAEHKEVDGTRRIGDVLLMRIRRERYMELRQAAEDARLAAELGISGRLETLGEQGRRYGLKVHTDLSTVRSGDGTLLDVVEKRAGAHDVARKAVDKKLRDGTIPGMEVPHE